MDNHWKCYRSHQRYNAKTENCNLYSEKQRCQKNAENLYFLFLYIFDFFKSAIDPKSLYEINWQIGTDVIIETSKDITN